MPASLSAGARTSSPGPSGTQDIEGKLLQAESYLRVRHVRHGHAMQRCMSAACRDWVQMIPPVVPAYVCRYCTKVAFSTELQTLSRLIVLRLQLKNTSGYYDILVKCRARMSLQYALLSKSRRTYLRTCPATLTRCVKPCNKANCCGQLDRQGSYAWLQHRRMALVLSLAFDAC
jgi:hypothetical protein